MGFNEIIKDPIKAMEKIAIPLYKGHGSSKKIAF
jgi:hypothetical protein